MLTIEHCNGRFCDFFHHMPSRTECSNAGYLKGDMPQNATCGRIGVVKCAKR